MKEQSITFYPVGNGDTNLIRLNDGTTIIIDCHVLDDAIFDVKNHLVEMLNRKSGVPHADVFILTHPHDDHIHGFSNTFYVGDPGKYSKKDEKEDRIIIDELWFAPRIFNDEDQDITDEAKTFKKEAERRIDIYKSGDESRLLPGNRLRLIGATDNLDCDGLDDLLTIPGQTLNRINGDTKKDFRFFVFAPVKKDSDNDDIEANNTSIVLQARFDVDGEPDAVRAFFGGDAESSVWQRIVKVNDDENLTWDLLLAPHHCSWTFFNEKGDDPLEESLHLLNQKRGKAYIVASSKPIKDNDDNPPSYKAKKQYLKIVGDDRFLCTDENSSEENPEPIHFLLSKKGITKSRYSESNQRATVAAVSNVVSTPRTYG